MRRLALLMVGGAVWLFLLAIPVLADGGVHVAYQNSGAGTYPGTNTAGVLTSDNCAGCHRAHTAQGFDITVQETPALCLTCHENGLGATTDVANGIQYQANADGTGNTSTVLGALRAGGFVNARIDSGTPARLLGPRFDSTAGAWVVSGVPKVGVAAQGQAVTSKHMGIDAEVIGTVWGSGPLAAAGTTSSPGATMTLNCTSCHNPHGNGQYRILNPVPKNEDATIGAGDFTTVTNPAALTSVTDNPPYPTDGTKPVRNYTVIQTPIAGVPASSTTDPGPYKATTGQGLFWTTDLTAYTETQGDYFRRNVPWTKDQQSHGTYYTDYRTSLGGSGTASFYNGDSPNGVFTTSLSASTGRYSESASFGREVSAWCAQCHQRYHTGISPSPGQGTGLSQQIPSGDSIFNYRHGTVNTACTVCHVAHGSNAQMPGVNSASQSFPGGTALPSTDPRYGDSRLLKVNNRGTCQLCHEPTGTQNVFTGPSSSSVQYADPDGAGPLPTASSDPYSGPATIPSVP